MRVVREVGGQAEAVGVDLLLFPECFLQGYLVTEQHVGRWAFEAGSPEFGAVLTRLAGIRPTLVLGVIERSRGAYYNTALVIRSGRVVGGYRKTFLTGAEPVFTAGHAYPVFDCAGVRFGTGSGGWCRRALNSAQ